MKKIFLASIALSAVSAFAQNQASGFDGFVSAGVGTNKISAYEFSDSSTMSNFRGTFSYAHTSGFGIQVDNVIDNQDFAASKIRTNDLALHGFYRNDNYLIGGIYQTRNFKAKADSITSTLPIDRTFAGFEGLYDFGDVTVYGLTANDKVEMGFIGPGVSANGRTSLIEARYFFNENLRTDVSYATSKFSEMGDTSKTNTTSVGVEYKFNDSPFSAFAKYQNMNGSFVDTKRFYVGVTLNFGKETLKARNASGASLNPIGVDNQILGIFSPN
ncbi:MAG: hypothetical protein ACOYB1_08405 [Limnohabitans sp.]